MKRLLLLLLLLVPSLALSQTTTVTGVVVDANGNPYFPGTISASVVLNTGQPTPAGVPASGSIGPFATTSGGNFSVTVASPLSWIFTICSPPTNIGPRGNGTPTQVCFNTSPIAVSGGSQVITGSLPAIPILGPSNALNSVSKFDTNGIYVAVNCGTATGCFQVFADVQMSTNGTWSNVGTTVTTIATDPVFVSSDTGAKQIFGASSCAGDVSRCTYSLKQQLMTFVSAHVASFSTVTTAATSGTANANNVAWGHDDGTTLASAFQAMFPLSFNQTTQALVQPQKSLYLPCGMMFTGTMPFIPPATAGPNGGAIQGCGSGSPIILLPKMPCNNNGTFFNACLFAGNNFNLIGQGLNLPGWHVKDVTFWGLGTDVKDAAATYSNPAVGVLGNFTDEFDNVWIIGWVWNNATSVTGINLQGSTGVNSGSVAGGVTACVLAGSAGTVGMMLGGSCGGGFGPALSINQAVNQIATTEGIYFNQSFGGHDVDVTAGVWNDHGSHVTGDLRMNGANALAYLNGTTLDQFGGGNSTLTVVNGNVHLNNVHFLAQGAPINQTGGTIYDDCGNGVLPVGGGVPIITNLFGACSVTGVADVAGNHALTSGWGTANVNTVTGSVNDVKFTISITGGAPAASPVLTGTFATPYWATPSGGCFLIQVGGTFGVLSNPVPSALSRTGVAWTFTGTPVNGQSYIYVRHCGNS